jgi:hypothetical protein
MTIFERISFGRQRRRGTAGPAWLAVRGGSAAFLLEGSPGARQDAHHRDQVGGS